mgnify:CR=1 FL=1
MPRRLLDRCSPDSIREFCAAARQRFSDGIALAAAGRRTGAIYLWGYSAEMILKAAYFSLSGIAETQRISWPGDLRPAIDRGRAVFHIAWPSAGAGHNVRAWAELLIAERAATSAYPRHFALEVQAHGQRIGSYWNETLRYRKNFAYLYEVRMMREAAEWLLVNSSRL